MKPKKIFFILVYILNFNFIFADPIVSGFGIFYKTSYEDGINQIKEDGFNILEEEIFRNTNTDRKLIKVSEFEYDHIPYKNGTFCFDRDSDGKYYFTIAEGDVNTNKIDNDLDYAAWFFVFLKTCKEKYIMESEQTSYSKLIGFVGDNKGMIILSISDDLHISYHPKYNEL